MVQNFAVFADKLATAKKKIIKNSMGGESDDVIVNEPLTYRAGEQSIEQSIQPC